MMSRPSSLRLLAAALLGATALSCGGSDSGTPPDDTGDRIDRVVVTPATATIEIDATVQLSAAVFNERGENVTSSVTVSWSSTPTSVATVSSTGLVTGVDDGTATVRAAVGSVSDQAAITVTDPDPPAAPSDVTASAVSDTEIAVAWSDNADNEELFRIEREVVGLAAAEGSGPEAVFEEAGTVGENVTTFTDTGLNPQSSYRYLVRACNGNGCTPASGSAGEGDVTTGDVTTHPTLVIETSSVPPGVVNQAYETTLVASGGTGTFEWTVSAGALPGGLSLSTAGVIAGTPTETGTFPFTAQVTSGGQSAAVELSLEVIEIVAPEITTTELPNGVVGADYAAQLQAEKGDGNDYAFEIIAGSPPDGLTLATDGTISGTPTAAGSSTFTVQVTSAGLVGTAELTITVYEPLQVTTTTLPTGVVGASYGASLSASGGDTSAAYQWEITAGPLPDGLALGADGTLSGTPTTAGTTSFTVQVTSADGQTATAELSITVYEALDITTTSFPDGSVGVAYSATAMATGGDGDHTWSVSALPNGLSLNASTGEISGEPTEEGTVAFDLTVTSGDGQTDTDNLSITVTGGAPVITTTSLPDGEVGVAYSRSLTATGGDGSYVWSLAAGSGPLPGGLTLSSGGVISGEPDAAGTFNFTVQVESGGQTDQQALSITVTSTPLSFAREVLLGAYNGAAYSDDIEPASGGAGSVTYSHTGGTLPPGISLSGTTLAGMPTSPGMYFFEITASDGSQSVSDVFTITVSTKASSAFNLHAHSIADQIPSSSVQTAINDVLARYEQIVTANVPGGPLPTMGADDSCSGNYPVFYGETVDDVHVLMNIAPDDGPGGRLGFAGLCGFIRNSPPATITGQLTLDIDDLEDPSFSASEKFNLIWHEIGHIMGIGGPWNCCGYDLADGRDGPGGATPTYKGSGGVSEYNTLQTDAGETPSSTVPIEDDFGSGTIDSHWDEGVFNHEIMTGFSEGGGTEAISRLTIAGLADLAWTVSFATADPYSLPSCRPNCGPLPAPPGAPPGAPPMDEDGPRPPRDDVKVEPLFLLLPDGTVRRIEPIR